jgi:hypothetical protein
MPQVVIDLSTALVTRLFHNLIDQSALVTCVDIPGAQGMPVRHITATNVTEVVAFRGDDPAFQPVLDGIAADLAAIDPNTEVDREFIQRMVTVTQQTTLDHPMTFLAVSVEFRLFDDPTLDGNGDLEAPGDPTHTHFVFDRSGSSEPNHFPPLLFRVRESFFDSVASTLELAIDFVSVLDTVALGGGGSNARALIFSLRQRFANQNVPLSLTSFVASLGGGTILNAGIITEPWPGGTNAVVVGDGGEIGQVTLTGSTAGIRLGIDVFAPQDLGSWDFFYGDNALSLQQGEHWSLLATGDLMIELAKNAVRPSLKPMGGYKFGHVARAPELDGSWDGKTLTLHTPVYDSNDFPDGTAYFKLTVSLSPRTDGHNDLGLEICADFSTSGLADFLGVIVGAVVGGAFFGPIGAVLLAVAGGLVAALGFGAIAKGKIAGGLGSASLPISCNPVQNDCRHCTATIDRFVEFVGTLRLGRVTMDANGMWLAGGIDFSPAAALPGVGAMDLTFHPWAFPVSACEPPSDPVKTLRIANTGDLPLTICTIEQGPGQTPGILYLLDYVGGHWPGDVTVAGGTHVDVRVEARLGLFPVYDPARPLPLRILTSGGARSIDLNSGDPARAEDPAAKRMGTIVAEILCDAANVPVPVWKAVPWVPPYVDPSPQTVAAHESLAVVAAGVPANEVLEGLGDGDIVLARAHGGGDVELMLDRPAGHGVPVDRAGLAVRLASGARHPIPDRRRHRTTRAYYLEGPWMQLPGAIQAFARRGGLLAVSTGATIHLVEVGTGAMREAAVRAFEGSRDVASTPHEWIVVADRGVCGLAVGTLARRWRIEEGGHAVASVGDQVYVARSDHVLVRGTDGAWQPALAGHATCLVAGRNAVFARVDGTVWRLHAGGARDLGLRAERLTTLGGRVLATHGGNEGASLLDEAGNVAVRYARVPWQAGLVEFGNVESLVNVAIEVRADQGLLVRHSRVVTAVDGSRLSPELVGGWVASTRAQ